MASRLVILRSLVKLAGELEPPLRLIAASDAVNAVDAKLANMKAELDRWRGLSVSTDDNYGT
jgi:hypothetical protein